MPPNLGGFFMVRSYYPSECHADYFCCERIEALKPAIEACGISFLSQAEDGIRHIGVTGVQTCALPISTTIPVVAITGDPVIAGLVQNLARPGGNITGVSTDEIGRASCRERV